MNRDFWCGLGIILAIGMFYSLGNFIFMFLWPTYSMGPPYFILILGVMLAVFAVLNWLVLYLTLIPDNAPNDGILKLSNHRTVDDKDGTVINIK